MTNRQPPHSNEAEQSVLGGILIDPSQFDEVNALLDPCDFYFGPHRIIFETIDELSAAGSVVDIITLAERLDAKSTLEQVGGLTYLSELQNGTPTAANVLAYSRIVIDKSKLRRVVATGSRVMQLGLSAEEKSADYVINQAEHMVYEIASNYGAGNNLKSVTKLLPETLGLLDELQANNGALPGVPSGFHALDKMTHGFQKGNLIILAGRPAMGKTAFAMNIAENIAVHKRRSVLVFSLEMPDSDLMLRLMASVARVSQSNIRSGQLKETDWTRITQAITKMNDAPLFIDDSAKQTPNSLRSVIRRFTKSQAGEPPSLVIVDYLQLMDSDRERDNRVAEMTEISRSLKQIAKEFNCPVIALSQLNRQLEGRTNKRPMASDLRESGSIEQDADLILAIYRDEVYNSQGVRGEAELLVLKHRNGPVGERKLVFLPELTRFENIAAG